jgi:hypothetical protein
MYENLLLTSFISKNSTLLFTIEQWDLTRRLKNSGLTKEQLCQAFDDLDRMETELGGLYNISFNNSQNGNSSTVATSNLNNGKAAGTNGTLNKNAQMQYGKANGNYSGSAANGVKTGNYLGENVCLPSSAASIVVNNFFASIIDPDVENKQVDEFRRFVLH